MSLQHGSPGRRTALSASRKTWRDLTWLSSYVTVSRYMTQTLRRFSFVASGKRSSIRVLRRGWERPSTSDPANRSLMATGLLWEGVASMAVVRLKRRAGRAACHLPDTTPRMGKLAEVVGRVADVANMKTNKVWCRRARAQMLPTSWRTRETKTATVMVIV